MKVKSFSVANSRTNFRMGSTMLLILTIYLKNHSLLALPSNTVEKSTFIKAPGDVLIGGLSPIHYPLGVDEIPVYTKLATGARCEGRFNFRGLQHAEAILYAVDKINEDKTLLPGITLGVDIRDTCNSVDYAIREALQFSFVLDAYEQSIYGGNGCAAKKKATAKTVAIVGAAYSGISMAIANLAGLFYVPMVSYASTSRLLSDRTRFKYFLRTVPSDNLQAQAIVDIIREFGWSFVATVASDTEYGRSGIEAFKSIVSQLRNISICIAVDGVFTTRTPKQQVRQIIGKLKRHEKARVVVLFAETNDAQYFLETAREENLTGKIWIGSDAFARSYEVLNGNEAILEHWIAASPVTRDYEPFMEYFRNMSDYRLKRNPWLEMYADEIAAHLNATDRIEYSPYTITAIDAVYAVAHGLHDMYRCTDSVCDEDAKETDQMEVFGFIKNAISISPTGQRIAFNVNGSTDNRYLITYVERRNQTLSRFSVLGEWDLHSGLSVFNRSNQSNPFLRPNMVSRCSEPCKLGFRKNRRQKFAECCWECIRCRGNTMTNQSGLPNCITCPPGTLANEEKSSCDNIPPTFIAMTKSGLAVISSCVVGTLVVIATLIVFLKHSDSPIVRASSKEISCIILLGTAWNFATAIVMILEPTTLLCQLRPFLTSTGIAAVICSLLSKTNRISRIFSLKAMRTGKPMFVSNKWHIGFVCACVLIGNLVALAWVLISPFHVVSVPHGEEVTIECGEPSKVGFAVWTTYHVGLTILCTYQAFLVRKVPENYNEAKFIAFTMVTLCMSGVVYVPTYFGTAGFYRIVLTAFLYIFCSYISLVCLFGPKLYIICFRPDKNVPLAPKLDSNGSISFKPPYSRSPSALTTLAINDITSSAPPTGSSACTRDSDAGL